MIERWIACVGLGMLAACGTTAGEDAGSGAGNLRIVLHDAPAAGVDEVWVTFDEVTVHSAMHGWLVVSTNLQSVNLLALQSGVVAELGLASLAPGTYDQVRLHLTDSWVRVSGDRLPLEVPSGTTSGLKIDGEFRVDSCATTTITLDWDAGAHLQSNQPQGWMLRPVIRIESVTTAIGPTTILADTFDRDDGDALGGGWLEHPPGIGDLDIDNGAVIMAVGQTSNSWARHAQPANLGLDAVELRFKFRFPNADSWVEVALNADGVNTLGTSGIGLIAYAGPDYVRLHEGPTELGRISSAGLQSNVDYYVTASVANGAVTARLATGNYAGTGGNVVHTLGPATLLGSESGSDVMIGLDHNIGVSPRLDEVFLDGLSCP